MQSMQMALKFVNLMIPVLKLDILVSILYIKSLKLNISVSDFNRVMVHLVVIC